MELPLFRTDVSYINVAAHSLTKMKPILKEMNRKICMLIYQNTLRFNQKVICLVPTAISWILYCLALYPEHQQKCREEIDLLFENGNDLQR